MTYTKKNEQAVREQIINPILKSLGWNLENPEEVVPNLSIEGGVPDYTLKKDEAVLLFVEVKNLSVDIEEKEIISQLAKYCFNEGVKYGVLTNGIVWILIRSFEEGTKLVERIVWKIDLESEEFTAIERKMKHLSKDNIQNIEELIKKVQILEETWQSILDNPESITKSLLPTFKFVLSQSYPNFKFDDIEIEDFLKERVEEYFKGEEESIIPLETIEKTGIKKMKIGEEEFEIRYSYEILLNTANWLIKKGRLKRIDCPIQIGRGKRYLINTLPKHKYGNNFISPKQLSNGLYIETNYSTANCINLSKKLLEKFGISSNYLRIT